MRLSAILLVALFVLMALNRPAAGEVITVQLIGEPVPDPQLGPSWTYPGNIFNHLAGDEHQFDASGMTTAQAEDYHSDLHNAEQQGFVSTAVRSFGSNCPGGVCPVNQVRTLSRSATVTRQRDSASVRRLFSRRNRGRLFGRLIRWWRR